MSDQTDETQNYALMVVAGLLALVIAGVLGLAVSRAPGGEAASTSKASAAALQMVAGEPEGRIYFASGSDALPADSSAVLVRVADAARREAGRVVLISGFHDSAGDAASNAELAKKRALAVRHALEANGVAPDRLVMDKPIVTAGSTDAREARRVELRLR